LTDNALSVFADKVAQSKAGLLRILNGIGAAEVYGIGAPSRASTLVNYVGFDEHMMSVVLETPGSKKIGMYMPGTRIPIEDEARLYTHQPEYALLLSWHIADELMPKLRAKGFKGKFIIPLPEPRIVDC